MRNASKISRLMGCVRFLALVCAPFLVTGCQHPMAPSPAGQRSASVSQVGNPPLQNASFRYSEAPARVQVAALKTNSPDAPKAKEPVLMGCDQKKQECLTVELGDALLDAFKVFTNRP